MELSTKLLITPQTLWRSFLMSMLVAISGAFAVNYVGSTSLLPVLPAVLGAAPGGLAPSLTWQRKLQVAAEPDDVTVGPPGRD